MLNLINKPPQSFEKMAIHDDKEEKRDRSTDRTDYSVQSNNIFSHMIYVANSPPRNYIYILGQRWEKTPMHLIICICFSLGLGPKLIMTQMVWEGSRPASSPGHVLCP